VPPIQRAASRAPRRKAAAAAGHRFARARREGKGGQRRGGGRVSQPRIGDQRNPPPAPPPNGCWRRAGRGVAHGSTWPRCASSRLRRAFGRRRALSASRTGSSGAIGRMRVAAWRLRCAAKLETLRPKLGREGKEEGGESDCRGTPRSKIESPRCRRGRRPRRRGRRGNPARERRSCARTRTPSATASGPARKAG